MATAAIAAWKLCSKAGAATPSAVLINLLASAIVVVVCDGDTKPATVPFGTTPPRAAFVAVFKARAVAADASRTGPTGFAIARSCCCTAALVVALAVSKGCVAIDTVGSTETPDVGAAFAPEPEAAGYVGNQGMAAADVAGAGERLAAVPASADTRPWSGTVPNFVGEAEYIDVAVYVEIAG